MISLWYQMWLPRLFGAILSVQTKPWIVFLFCFSFPRFIKRNEIRGLWMLGTCLFFKFYMCHLISVLCHFCKEKNTILFIFCLIFCGCILYLFNSLHCFLLLIKQSHSLVSLFIWFQIKLSMGFCFWKLNLGTNIYCIWKLDCTAQWRLYFSK